MMAIYGLATPGAMASAAMILTEFTHNGPECRVNLPSGITSLMRGRLLLWQVAHVPALVLAPCLWMTSHQPRGHPRLAGGDMNM